MKDGGRHYVGQKVEETVKGKVLEACVVPVCVYGLGTLAPIERLEEKVRVAEQQLGSENMQSEAR